MRNRDSAFMALIIAMMIGAFIIMFTEVEVPKLIKANLFNGGGQKVQVKEGVSILAFGDVSFDRYIRKRIGEEGKDAVLAGMEPIRYILNNADIVFVNLEGPVTENRITTGKEIAFQFDPDSLEILKNFSVDIASTANNHAYDMGKNAVEDTRKFLADYGIISVGDAKGTNEKSSYETIINGKKVAFAAFNHTDYRLDFDSAAILISELKARNDIVIVSIHWGREYFIVPSDFQRDMARKFVESGADVIIGHHPHVIEGMEFIDGKPVFYSLGNFVFDQWFMDETQEGLGIELIFSDASTKIHLLPFKIDKGFPYIPTDEESQAILNKFYSYSFSTNPEINDHLDLFQNISPK
ncbi:MAG: CapA family protein [Candidatus Peregrinibacteria bacterium]|nr:CapA family protein [Candidatus Peregrinibacteria bacterium]MDZ4245145.1 CapA family protein [Candidatus Gracilibacteria bacterium]